MKDIWPKIYKAFLYTTCSCIVVMAFYMTFFKCRVLILVAELWHILIIGCLAGLSALIFYSPKELPFRKMLFRHIIHGIVVLSVIVFFIFRWRWIDTSSPLHMVVILAIVVVIYTACMVILFWRDKMIADQMNVKLQEYQSRTRPGKGED